MLRLPISLPRPRSLVRQNVLLLDRRGGLLDLRIADFGVARRLGPAGTTTGRAGSAGYMSPEVLSDEPYGLAADVWSLGVILYTLLSGCMPFLYDNPEQEEAAVRDGRWSFSDSNWDEVSFEAKDMVRMLLSQASHKRPTASEALDLAWVRVRASQVAPTVERVGASISGVGGSFNDVAHFANANISR